MPKLIIDGNEHEFEDGMTLIQACEETGIEIPRFCYHERLSIAGNCRMCLIEVAGMPKPMASCAMSVNDLRPGKDGEPPEIKTNSEMVKKAREGVMEFLLINHPLDCPICDQGGECDLQDQAMAFGVDASRFALNKRAVEDKNIGPLIKTEMTRCIHCTRCVRFMTEVAGVEELGAIGRGEDMEITTYLEEGMTSELSGNVIDLCPVGALTSKPYAFAARSWELRKTESIDAMDAVGSSIRVDTRGREVMRVMPRNNDAINEEWISDKTRFIWDGLKTQRLDQPYVRKNGKLVPATWDEAFLTIDQHLKKVGTENGAAIVGDLAAAEEIFALKDLTELLGWIDIECRQNGSKLHPSYGRSSYLFNSTIEGIEEADAILLIGTNPKKEAAVLNGRIRKRWRSGNCSIALIGQQLDTGYPYEYLGAGPDTLQQLIEGNDKFADILKSAKNPMIILGQAALTRKDSPAILALVAQLCTKNNIVSLGQGWNGFNILHTTASQVAAMDLGFTPKKTSRDIKAILKDAKSGDIKTVYLLGADEIDMSQLEETFVIYQGTHGDKGAHCADVILPGAAYTEKVGTYVNLEGRVQQTVQAIFPPGDAKEDWKILRALSAVIGHQLPYDNIQELRARMYETCPHFAEIDQIAPRDNTLEKLQNLKGKVLNEPFGTAIDNFYLTNPIARASAIMAEMSVLTTTNNNEATGTHG